MMIIEKVLSNTIQPQTHPPQPPHHRHPPTTTLPQQRLPRSIDKPLRKSTPRLPIRSPQRVQWYHKCGLALETRGVIGARHQQAFFRVRSTLMVVFATFAADVEIGPYVVSGHGIAELGHCVPEGFATEEVGVGGEAAGVVGEEPVGALKGTGDQFASRAGRDGPGEGSGEGGG